jgi:hypothetical protein
MKPQKVFFDTGAHLVALPLSNGGLAPAFAARAGREEPRASEVDTVRRPAARIGIVFNRRAHRNLQQAGALPTVDLSLDWASPQTEAELSAALARFAARKVDAIVVDGGDGTIRDVITAAAAHFPKGLPRLAVVPSGKTNALAFDLGIPRDWTLDDALATIATGRVSQRSPIEITRADGSAPVARGFLFGAGAFVKATALAQGVHRLGAFRGLAVAMSIGGAVAQTMFAGAGNPWRQGERMRIELRGGRTIEHRLYLMLASTLERLPLGLKPFGRVRAGLKLLGIDAPPRRMVVSLPALLAGSEADWLRRAGYHRGDAERLDVTLSGGFILDGEAYEGGALSISQGTPLDFYVP